MEGNHIVKLILLDAELCEVLPNLGVLGHLCKDVLNSLSCILLRFPDLTGFQASVPPPLTGGFGVLDLVLLEGFPLRFSTLFLGGFLWLFFRFSTTRLHPGLNLIIFSINVSHKIPRFLQTKTAPSARLWRLFYGLIFYRVNLYPVRSVDGSLLLYQDPIKT